MPTTLKKTADILFKEAEKGFLHWSKTSLAKRAETLLKFAKQLDSEKDVIAQSLSQEIGKPLWESKNELQSAIAKIQISIDAFRLRCPENIRALPQGRLITRHKPHGVALVLGPYNFPIHLPNGHIIPALLAGNSIVFKPSEHAPLTAELYVEAAYKAGIPRDALILADASLEAAKSLLEQPFNQILFTGSVKVGKLLLQKFADKPEVILALEMGGNNPLIVSEISDFHSASYQTIQSAFLTSGQRCTCARRLIVPQGIKGDAFLKELVHMTSQIRVGLWNEKPEPFMGPLVSAEAANRVKESVQKLIDNGAKALIPLVELSNHPALLSPAILDVTPVKNRPDEEIFGPVLQVIRVKNLDKAIDEANNTRYGLSAGLFSDSEKEYEQFFERIRAGIVNWNVPLTGASSWAPFGGVGLSGNGRPSAFYAADYAAYPVASIEAPTLNIPPNLPPGLEGVKK